MVRCDRGGGPPVAGTVTAVTLLLAGCSLSVEGPQATLWEGSLESTGEEPVLTGSAAAVSRESSTQIGVEVTGGEVGDRWRWSLREGTCDSPGPVVGSPDDYPVVQAQEETDPTGPDGPDAPGPVIRGSVETVVATTLDSSGDYHATVAADTAPDTPLACGVLGMS